MNRWLVLSVLVPPAGEEFLMVDGLRRLGARAIEREGQRVIAWLPPPGDVDEAIRDARVTLRGCTTMTDTGLAWQWRSHEEWAERWVREVGPRRVSDRIVVMPAGASCGDAADHDRDIVVRLEAGIAFGNAEHATTRGCLRLIERVIRPGDRVLDIGTGSGVLAIAAALLGAGDVLAVEADALSCESARRNVVANGVAGRVTVRQAVVTAGDAPEGRRTSAPHDDQLALVSLPRSDVILANVEAGLIRSLMPGLAGALAPGGTVIVSGVTAGERADVVDDAVMAGLGVHDREQIEGWLTLALTP